MPIISSIDVYFFLQFADDLKGKYHEILSLSLVRKNYEALRKAAGQFAFGDIKRMLVGLVIENETKNVEWLKHFFVDCGPLFLEKFL